MKKELLMLGLASVLGAGAAYIGYDTFQRGKVVRELLQTTAAGDKIEYAGTGFTITARDGTQYTFRSVPLVDGQSVIEPMEKLEFSTGDMWDEDGNGTVDSFVVPGRVTGLETKAKQNTVFGTWKRNHLVLDMMVDWKNAQSAAKKNSAVSSAQTMEQYAYLSAQQQCPTIRVEDSQAAHAGEVMELSEQLAGKELKIVLTPEGFTINQESRNVSYIYRKNGNTLVSDQKGGCVYIPKAEMKVDNFLLYDYNGDGHVDAWDFPHSAYKAKEFQSILQFAEGIQTSLGVPVVKAAYEKMKW